METSIRRKTLDGKLVLTSWSNNTYDTTEDVINDNPNGSFVALGAYNLGEGHCEKAAVDLFADKNGKLTLTVFEDVLEKFGIKLNIKKVKKKVKKTLHKNA